MRKHQFAVGILTELAPHEHPNLLGLNVSAGQAIKLRLRTNDYEGFRTYKEVRRVLCHELTHNVWGDHDNNVCAPCYHREVPFLTYGSHSQFKELNSLLNREVVEFERAASEGAHQLYDSGEVYEPDAQILAGGGSYVLGGSSSGSSPDTVAERRRKMLQATMNRLRKEEEELEQSCGTTGSSAEPQS